MYFFGFLASVSTRLQIPGGRIRYVLKNRFTSIAIASTSVLSVNYPPLAFALAWQVLLIYPGKIACEFQESVLNRITGYKTRTWGICPLVSCSLFQPPRTDSNGSYEHTSQEQQHGQPAEPIVLWGQASSLRFLSEKSGASREDL
jgi:hypothetical protein